MSAYRDRTQGFAFVYSNLYHLYRKGKKAATESNSGAVLKAEDLRSDTFAHFKVRPYTPVDFITKRQEAMETRANHVSNHAIASLKGNLQQLNELHSRLKFMLTELDTLIKEDDRK